ncbi:MAG: NUDIX hydrolase [Marinirhabdus sp.]
MDFTFFEQRIVKITNLDLPGAAFHLKMAPTQRLQALQQRAILRNTARRAGVVALFYPSLQGEARFLLILRKTYKGVHSGQVGFPGGKREKGDATIEVTALRETEEEVGVPRAAISVLKKLTEIYIPPSDFFVQPFLGVAHVPPKFFPQETEVEALIEVPVREFMAAAVKTTKNVAAPYAAPMAVPAFLLQGHVVWGATAMMLNEIRQCLKQLL